MNQQLSVLWAFSGQYADAAEGCSIMQMQA